MATGTRGWGSVRARFALLFIYPLGLFRRNPAVLLVVLVVVFNVLAPDEGVFNDILRRGWLFDEAPGLLGSLIGSPLVVAAGAGFLAKNLLNVVVSQQLMLIFRAGRTTLRETVRTLRVGSFVWLTAVQGCTYAGFAVGAGLVYLPALLTWRFARVDLTIPFLAAAVLAYPAFDLVISTAVIASVLPVPVSRRTALLRFIRRPSFFGPLYAYGAARTVVETLLLALGPLILLDLVHSRPLASATMALGLVLPFLVLRGASYALTLDRMRSDEDISSVFADHFERVALNFL
jgi:hypothetical protein